MMNTKGSVHILSTIAIIIAVGLGGVILLAEAADSQNIFISTPTHAEAYYLEVNGTIILQANGAITCNSTYTGALYWDGSDHYSCNSTAWNSITAGGVGDGYCDGSSCNVANTGTLDGYEASALLDNTDAQTLSWNDITDILSISGGNSVNLSNLSSNDGDNASWNESYANTLYHPLWDYDYADLIGVPTHLSNFTDNLEHVEDNVSWNQSFANTLYHPLWDYNYADLVGTPTHLSNFTDDLGHIEESTVNGSGLSLSGYTLSISSSYAGQTSITTLGTITTGTWEGTSIGITYTDAKDTTADTIADDDVISDSELDNENFGEFTCTGAEDGCTLNSGVYDDEYIELEDSFLNTTGGEILVSGTYQALIMNVTTLQNVEGIRMTSGNFSLPNSGGAGTFSDNSSCTIIRSPGGGSTLEICD